MLEVNNLTMQFGALKSINDLSIKVNQGEVVSVIGPNGAGKTTLFNVITGIYTPTSGSVMLGEKKLNGLSPAKVNQVGIARTFQNVRLFLNMSVVENVMAATYAKTKSGLFASALALPSSRREEKAVRERAEELLSFFGTRLTGYRWGEPAYSLSKSSFTR